MGPVAMELMKKYNPSSLAFLNSGFKDKSILLSSVISTPPPYA